MKLLGLTGGIASGKSTVARLLERKGAVIVDADVIGHEVYAPGSDGHSMIVERFGDQVLAEDGTIDRAKLGAIVFADKDERAALESITHPAIMAEIASRVEGHRQTDKVVVIDAALLVEAFGGGDPKKRLGLDALVVVSADPQDQIERMVRDRGHDESSATQRIGAQMPIEKKLALADYILHNRGSLEELEQSVELLWDDLHTRLG